MTTLKQRIEKLNYVKFLKKIKGILCELALNSGGTTSKEVNLTSSDIIGLNTSPLEVIPSPGVGKVIVVNAVAVNFKFGTVAFNGSGIGLRTATAAVEQFSLVTSEINSNSDYFKNKTALQIGSPIITLVENQPLELIDFADITVGDSNIDLYIDYKIITL